MSHILSVVLVCRDLSFFIVKFQFWTISKWATKKISTENQRKKLITGEELLEWGNKSRQSSLQFRIYNLIIILEKRIKILGITMTSREWPRWENICVTFTSVWPIHPCYIKCKIVESFVFMYVPFLSVMLYNFQWLSLNKNFHFSIAWLAFSTITIIHMYQMSFIMNPLDKHVKSKNNKCKTVLRKQNICCVNCLCFRLKHLNDMILWKYLQRQSTSSRDISSESC